MQLREKKFYSEHSLKLSGAYFFYIDIGDPKLTLFSKVFDELESEFDVSFYVFKCIIFDCVFDNFQPKFDIKSNLFANILTTIDY